MDSAARAGGDGPAPGGAAVAGTPPAEGTGEPAAPWLDDAEMTAWLSFLEVGHLLDRAIERQLRQDAGLSHAQYEVLARLSARGGRMRMGDLAEGIVVSRSGLTYQVAQLEKTGLVRRERCPGDDRGIVAVLTAAGRGALARAAPGHVAVVRRYLIDALSQAERTAMTSGLTAARARLRASPAA